MDNGVPSSSEEWLSHLVNFQATCLQGKAREQADRLRQAHNLFAIGHQISANVPDDIPSGARLEELLAIDACETAAISLLGPRTSFMLSRGTNGNCLATVIVPGNDNEITAPGETLALALLTAGASSVIEVNKTS